MKTSPFPGMDPFLEDQKLWPSFHHQFITCLYQVILPEIEDRYTPRIRQRKYQADEIPSDTLEPREHEEEFIVIHQRSDGRPVTLIDVVSPANKTTAVGRQVYLDTRKHARDAGASAVEIDLVLQGQPTLSYSREGLPDWDYALTVTRSSHPERFEIYTSTLQKRLPRFRLPLAPDDRDTVLDLQAVFNRCYDQGDFASRIDYSREPAVPLKDEARRWLSLHPHRGTATGLESLEKADFSHEQIAGTAYRLWQEEGCPPGRDQEYWYRAEEQVRRDKGSVHRDR